MAIGLYVVLDKLLEECTVCNGWWWGGLLVWMFGIGRLMDDTVALSLSMALNHRAVSQSLLITINLYYCMAMML